jgi:molybdopterin-guanine dinucleotide biosynthesis protein A
MTKATGTHTARTPGMQGYVVAGGQSRRFGQDKARALLDGQAMLTRMCNLVAGAAGSVRVVADSKARYADLQAFVVEDLWPGEGPLGGIVTALLATSAADGGRDWNLIVSCDMPFLTPEWLAHLVQRAWAGQAQVVLAHSAHGPEPLCACWRTDAVATLEAAFMRGVRRVNEGIALLRAEVLDERDWKRFDSAGRLFWNMNTPQDYEQARHILEAEQQ